MSDLLKEWSRVEDWLKKNAPKVASSLNPPANANELKQIQQYYGMKVPDDLIQLYGLHNGQSSRDSGVVNFFHGQEFLVTPANLNSPFADVIIEWDISHFESSPKEVHLSEDSFKLKVPLACGHVRYGLFVDLKPSTYGVFGQVIFIDSEAGRIWLVADSVTALVKNFGVDLHSGHYTISEDNSGWLRTSKEVDYTNWEGNGMDIRYPDGGRT